jgi:diacylglycerol kinase family enzyme
MIGVIVNPHAGYVAEHGVATVTNMILGAIPTARILVLKPQDDIAARCKQLISDGATCIAAVGGDGTVRAVAETLAGAGVALGVIPGGTLNHFARDVGVGRDVQEAVRTLSGCHTVPVDVATVNHLVFLNNSSIGLYPRMVRIRAGKEQELGKFRAMMRAGLLAIRRTTWTDICISSGDHTGKARTRLLFVGNNQYDLNLLDLGRRESLHEGILSCFIVDAPNRLRLIQTVFRSLSGRHKGSRYLRSLQATELTVSTSKTSLELSADGEIFTMTTPLVYRIRPGALTVVVPAPSSSPLNLST